MMEQPQKYLYLLVTLVSSCSLIDIVRETNPITFDLEGRETFNIYNLQSVELSNITAPTIKPVVAVYPTAITDRDWETKVTKR